MGNSETHEMLNHTELLTAKSRPQYKDSSDTNNMYYSDAEYLPMPLSMRRAIIDGKKFQLIVPRKTVIKDKEDQNQRNIRPRSVRKDEVIDTVKSSETHNPDVDETEYSKLNDCEMKFKVQPARRKEVEGIGKRKISKTVDVELRKSNFTMQMKKKMCQTRLKLLGLSSPDWKEFCFKDTQYSRDLDLSESTESYKDDKVYRAPQKCIQNFTCQIMRKDLKPPLAKGEKMSKYDVKHLLKKEDCNCDKCTLAYLTDMSPPRRPAVSSRIKKIKEDDGNGDFREDWKIRENKDGEFVKVSPKVSQSGKGELYFSSTESAGEVPEVLDSTNHMIHELFRKNRQSFCETSNGLIVDRSFITAAKSDSSCSNNVLGEDDSTELDGEYGLNELRTSGNKRSIGYLKKQAIERKCHTKHVGSSSLTAEEYLRRGRSWPFKTVKNIYKSTDFGFDMETDKRALDHNKVYIAVGSRKCTSASNVVGVLPVEDFQNKNPSIEKNDFSERKSESSKINSENSSSIFFGTTPSNSLSTVISYPRLRLMFQKFIERNRSRRTKRHIAEFRKMEELGLGELRDRRWYPGDKKTLSIWTGLHTVSGVQGHFRKYHKTKSK